MILNLPFVYSVRLRAGTQRRPREYRVRGYASVDVREITSSEMIEVVKCTYQGYRQGWSPHEFAVMIGGYGGRLYRPVQNGEGFLDGPGLEQALAEPPFDPQEFKSRTAWRARMPSGIASWPFPTPDIRNGEEPELDPRRLLSLPELRAELGLAAHPVDSTNFHERSAAAVAHLREAVLIVDGIVWMECPEPVWSISATDRCKVHFAPDRSEAWGYYRLDTPPPLRGEDPVGSHGIVRLLRPDLLRRDDVQELARAAISQWPNFRRAINVRDGFATARINEVDRILPVAGGGLPSQGDCIVVLDAYVFGSILLLTRGKRFRDRGRSITDRGGAIAVRWVREREAYFGRTADNDFSPGDLDALIGLEWEI